MKPRCLVALLCLLLPPALLLAILVAPAAGDALRDIGAALAAGLTFVAVILGGAILLLVVGLVVELRRPPYQPPAIYLVQQAPIAPSPLPARRAELADPNVVEGEYHERPAA